MESARNLAESAENMRRAATVGRENAARLDAVKKRLRETLGRNRRIAERMDEVIRSCWEARETMKRSIAELRRANATARGAEMNHQRAEQPPPPPRSAIGHLAKWGSEPESPLDLHRWNPSGDPH
jgi:hypothetical protein